MAKTMVKMTQAPGDLRDIGSRLIQNPWIPRQELLGHSLLCKNLTKPDEIKHLIVDLDEDAIQY